MKYIAGLAAVTAIGLVVIFAGSTRAASFDYGISSSYELRADNQVAARTIISVTNNVSTPSPTVILLPVAGEASQIEAGYQDGGSVSATYSAESGAIRLETPRDFSGQDRQWSLVVNYLVDVVQQFGNTTILSISPLTYGEMNVTMEQVSISTDLALGVALSRGPSPDVSKISAGKQILSWQESNGPLTSAVGVMFGENALADVTVSAQLSNSSWWWQTKTVTLPPDTNQQKVFLKSIDPKPSNLKLDIDGNVLAEYRLRPQQSLSVTAQVQIVVSNFAYALDNQLATNDVPERISQLYTTLEGPWQDTDVSVQIDDSGPMISNIREIYEAVAASNLENDDTYQQSLLYANNLIGELRAHNIPARLVLGRVFGDGGQVFEQSQPQAWVEAYSAGIGWLTLDPSFERRGDYFGITDVQHIGLVLRGLEPDFPPQQLADTVVAFSDDEVPEVPSMVPTLSATKYVILPGVAISSVRVSLPNGVIVDNAGYSVDSGPAHLLGSLAPLQEAHVRSFAWGVGAFTGGNLDYGLVENAQIGTVLASTQVGTNYLILIFLVVVAVVVFLVRWWWRRRNPKSQSSRRSRDAVVFATEESGESIESSDLLPSKELEKEAEQPNPAEIDKKPPPANRVDRVEPLGDTIKKTPDSLPHKRPHRSRWHDKIQ